MERQTAEAGGVGGLVQVARFCALLPRSWCCTLHPGLEPVAWVEERIALGSVLFAAEGRKGWCEKCDQLQRAVQIEGAREDMPRGSRFGRSLRNRSTKGTRRGKGERVV